MPNSNSGTTNVLLGRPRARGTETPSGNDVTERVVVAERVVNCMGRAGTRACTRACTTPARSAARAHTHTGGTVVQDPTPKKKERKQRTHLQNSSTHPNRATAQQAQEKRREEKRREEKRREEKRREEKTTQHDTTQTRLHTQPASQPATHPPEWTRAAQRHHRQTPPA